ncbi:MAG: alpha/beta fold hydrolase [bacterium]
MSLNLHFREYGNRDAGTPVLLLHGLFGSGINWHRVARELEDEHYLVVPDLRNHGRSPHHTDCRFEVMSDDVLTLMDALEIDAAKIIGHSMGGKVAMWLALHQPQHCVSLVVADMAPRAYPDRFSPLIKMLQSLPLVSLRDRAEADKILQAQGLDKPVRDYLLQNLVRESGEFTWRINLSALANAIDDVMGFPIVEGVRFDGPAMFVYGGASPYVGEKEKSLIHDYFPAAELHRLAGVGHWVYAEDPAGFLSAVRKML